jgi:hypothetical protein
MGQNKWEYRENFHSTGCGDYDGQYEITDGKIFICTADDPEDITENENALQQIARLFNESGCKFYSNNALELKQHIEIQELGYKINDLQAKCERYEKALRVIQKWQLPSTGKLWDHGTYMEPMSYGACYGSNGERDFMRNVANEALSAGEGENPGMPFINGHINDGLTGEMEKEVDK